MDTHELTAGPNRTPDQDAKSLALFGLLTVLILLSEWRSASAVRGSLDSASVRRGVDPNTAPWWELTALPEIGESTARQVIAYREAHADRAPIFRQPPDLEPVPDIGPKTIQRIAPHLRFEEASSSRRVNDEKSMPRSTLRTP